MKEQFVTYEIALALKELGFDEECLVYFNNDKYRDLICTCENGMDGDFTVHHYSGDVNAPLWQQVIDWFSDAHKIFIEIRFADKALSVYEFCVYKTFKELVNNTIERIGLGNDRKVYSTYFEAREQAILKAIELCQKEK